jgi:prevent-host-death family protein
MEAREIEVSGHADLERVVRAAKRGRSVLLTRAGRPRALVIDARDVQGLAETMEILADPTVLRRIQRAERDLRAGAFKTLDQVFPRRGRQRR